MYAVSDAHSHREKKIRIYSYAIFLALSLFSRHALPQIDASVGGTQRSADAVTQRISAALGDQPEHAHSQRTGLISSTHGNAPSRSDNPAASSADDANLLSTIQFAPDLMASMRSISDFSYDDDSMLASDPVFAGTGPAKHQPADSLASLLAAASQSGVGAVSEKRNGGR